MRTPLGTKVKSGRPSAQTLIIGMAALAVLGFLLFQALNHGHLGAVDEYDDGVYFGASIQLAHGILPYRDFAFIQPPLITVWLLPLAALTSWLSTGVAMEASSSVRGGRGGGQRRPGRPAGAAPSRPAGGGGHRDDGGVGGHRALGSDNPDRAVLGPGLSAGAALRVPSGCADDVDLQPHRGGPLLGRGRCHQGLGRHHLAGRRVHTRSDEVAGHTAGAAGRGDWVRGELCAFLRGGAGQLPPSGLRDPSHPGRERIPVRRSAGQPHRLRPTELHGRPPGCSRSGRARARPGGHRRGGGCGVLWIGAGGRSGRWIVWP